MKTIVLTAFICLVLSTANGQEKGINFQTKLTWAQVKEKAQKENKYIFVDCYTTWCVPCKVMAKYVFTRPEVSTFFNDKFVSVALQFDETKKDDADTKSWRAEVKRVGAKYKVNTYPTYLFFNPDGALVHSIIGGSDAATFLEKAKAALNPASQLANLKKQYADGNRSPEFMLTFIKALGMAWDGQTADVINVYLPTQKDLLTQGNLQLIYQATKKSAEPGYKIIREHSKEFDAVNGPGISRTIISTIAFDELVLPIVRKNGARVNNGGMYFYTGEINKNVDWVAVKAKLKAGYPDLADDIFATSRLSYLRDREDWPTYVTEANAYADKYNDIEHADQIDTFANYIYLSTDDKKCLEGSLNLTRKVLAIDGPKKDWYLIMYANLLDKTGKKDEALAIAADGIKRLGDKAYGFKELQDRLTKKETAQQ